MIQEVTMFGAICDCCQEAWYSDFFGYVAMSDESGLKEMLHDDEWHIADNGKTYCPSCFEVDEEDNVLVKTRKEVQR